MEYKTMMVSEDQIKVLEENGVNFGYYGFFDQTVETRIMFEDEYDYEKAVEVLEEIPTEAKRNTNLMGMKLVINNRTY